MANTKKEEKVNVNISDTQTEITEGNTDQNVQVMEETAVKKEKSWIVRVTNNPEYCGIGAGGTQFANGKAVIRSERMAGWFREHKGYMVTEQ